MECLEEKLDLSQDQSELGKSEVYVIIDIDKTYFGINSEYVREMVQVEYVRPIPEMPEYMLGVTNLRGKIVPLIDLRIRFGQTSLEQEAQNFITLLEEYEQAHKSWLKELEECIKEKREFKLARNPHKCKFGQWYDSYKSMDVLVANYLKKFNEPHKSIHGVADKALDLEDQGNIDEANELIENTKNTVLAEMLYLFDGLKDLLRERVKTLVLIIEVDSTLFGLNVDNINSVEEILSESKVPVDDYLTKGSGEDYISEMSKIKIGNEEKVVMILKPELLSK